METYSFDTIHENCVANLTTLMQHLHKNQKELAEEIDVTPATLSSYMKAKIPGTDFLLRLRAIYGIDIDQFLMSRISFEEELPAKETIHSDLYKYFGLYNLYYLDAASGRSKTENHRYLNATPDLKMGLLYIYKERFTGNAKVICVMNLPNREQVQELRDTIHSIASKNQQYHHEAAGSGPSLDHDFYLTGADTAEQFYRRMNENRTTAYKTYRGSLHMPQDHIFFRMDQEIDFEEQFSIILHRENFRRSQYQGGIGTLSAVSNGHTPEPCMQLIGISRQELIVSDETIKRHLRFSAPTVDSISTRETQESKQLLSLAEELFRLPVKGETGTPMYLLSREDKEVLFRSKLNYLIRSNIEKNLLYWVKVSKNEDHNWYLLISGRYHEILQPELEGR